MQSPEDGNMYPIHPEVAKLLQKEGGHCIISIGEIIEIKGGRFRVTHMGRKFIRLEGLPGTDVEEKS